MNRNKNIDEIFREKLRNYEPEPPAHLLEDVLAGVAGARRKRKMVFWRIAGVAAALLLAFVAGWQLNYLNGGSIKQQVVVSRNSSPEQKKAISVFPEPKTNQEKQQENLKKIDGSPINAGLDTSLPEFGPVALDEKANQPVADSNKATQGAEPLYPMKTLNRLLAQNSHFTNELQKKEIGGLGSSISERSIDEQIIEQNQQEMMARKELKRKALWMVGAQISPAYSVNRSSHSSQYASNMLNSSLKSPVDLGGGISVEYRPGKRWSLQSGVYYSGLAQTSGNTSRSTSGDYMGVATGSSNSNTPVNIEASKMSMNSNAGVVELKSVPSGIVLNANLEDKTMTSSFVASNVQFTQNFEYLEIPLYLRYTVIDSRFDVELLGGLSSNVLVGNGTYVEGSSGKTLVGTTKDMQWLNYSGTFGLGLKYGLSRHIFLNVEPRLKYYLNSLNNNAEVSYKPYTIGVYTGISYQF